MKTLELKDIAGYLPYGLKCLVAGEPERDSESITGLSCDCHGWWVDLDDEDSVMLDDIMPILRPMSDIVKDIEVNGEKIMPIIELAKLWVKDNLSYIPTSYEVCCHFGGKKEYIVRCNRDTDDRSTCGYYSFCQEQPSVSLVERDLLNELHFDDRNLIGQGLAIDINTLKEITP